MQNEVTRFLLLLLLLVFISIYLVNSMDIYVTELMI